MASVGIWERGREGLELGSSQKFFRHSKWKLRLPETWAPGPGVQNLIDRREIRVFAEIGERIQDETGIEIPAQLQEGEIVTCIHLRPAHLACGKYAIMQNASTFTLVPLAAGQPQMERFSGREISGTVDSQGIVWEFGNRQRRGLGI
jgi:hypothetical protein